MSAASVSVVIPLYNKRAYIARTLQSVMGQRRAPTDIIVVDDGSTDGGARLLDAFPALIRLSQAHAGPGAARNRGVHAARGDWIAFLDADDEWLPDFLARTTETAEHLPEAIAVFTNLVDERGRRLLGGDGERPRIIDDYFAFLLENRGIGMSSSSTMVRRDALLGCGSFPAHAPLGEDRDTWARLAWTGAVAFVPEPLAVYHTDVPNSVLKTADPRAQQLPVILHTYTAWRDSGRIPARLAETSRLCMAQFSVDYVAALAHDGWKRASWRMLRATRGARILSPLAFTAAALRLLIPSPGLRMLRRMKSRIVHGLSSE